MSSSVKDGKLIKASPSLINSFDPSTPFGCERRGWFKYVAGKEEPSTGNQSLGVELHRLNEEFLLGREVNSEIPEALTLFELGHKTLRELKAVHCEAFQVEHPVSTTLAGVAISGFCDFSAGGVIYDWKTTSNIKKYGKSSEELKKDTQMLIYARAIFPQRELISLAHGQYQTKGKPEFKVARVFVTKGEVDREIDTVIVPKIERIKTLVAESDVTKIDRNAKTCGMCPHRGYCPTKGSEAIMSIFNKYSKPAPQQAAVPEILPPDAPASDPQLASDPPPSVATPAAPAEAPKKRGRPLGSGKKFSDTPSPDVVFESVTVNYGVTVNLGNHNFTKIDVGMTARSSDSEAAYAEVLTKVKQKVVEELAIIEGLKEKK